jgi:release factor glutamine methyltransferase
MPPDNHSWSVLDVLKWTTSFFDSRDIDSPRLSAELLLAHVLGVSRLDLYLRFDQPLSMTERSRYRELIKRRADKEPVAYIIGSKSFWEMEFEITRDVLIPRPDTECLVESALDALDEDGTSKSSPRRVLELATGSGAVILSLAHRVPDCRFFASDISAPALRVAQRNAVRHALAGKVVFFASDWFTAVKPAGSDFDMIVVNPPYIASGKIEQLSPEIRLFEPRAALDGGADGLRHIRHILQVAETYLKPGGDLLMEIGWDQATPVRDMVKTLEQYASPRVIKDLAGHDRVVHLQKR